jgi:hypothetical protein
MKSGSLKLLETSGPVQDCNGIALPFYRNNSVIYPCTHRVTVCAINVFLKKAVRVPEPVWTFRRVKKYLDPAKATKNKDWNLIKKSVPDCCAC